MIDTVILDEADNLIHKKEYFAFLKKLIWQKM